MSKYLHGTDVLGALAPLKKPMPRSGFVLKKAPITGRQFTSLVVNRQGKHDPRKTLLAAQQAGKRAQSVAAKALKAIDKAQKNAVKAAKATKTAVVGALKAVRGRPAPRPLSQATIGQLKAQAMKLAAAGKAMSATADKYEKTLATARAKSLSAQKRAQGVTKIHGFDVEVLGQAPFHTEILGAAEQLDDAFEAFSHDLMCELLGDDPAPIPDPLNPGYMTDGSVDPSYGGGASSSGGGMAANMPGPPDYGAGPQPTPESVEPQAYVDYVPGPDAGTDGTFYDCPTDDDLPLGAIVFDGSRVPPPMTLGNMSAFFGTAPDNPQPKGGPYSGYVNGDSGWLYKLANDPNYRHADLPGQAMVSESQKNGWGPLVGAPVLPGTSTPSWTANLRFSASGPNGPRWFWFYDQAPDWAKTPVRLARLNDAIVAYKAAVTAGQTDYVNAQIQDKLDAQAAADQARAQAAQDAQLALQQQQMDAQQAAFDQQQAQQQAQMDLQVQQAQAQYFAQHPEDMFSPADAGYGDQGGDGANDVYDPFADGGDGGDDLLSPMPLVDDSSVDWGDDGTPEGL